MNSTYCTSAHFCKLRSLVAKGFKVSNYKNPRTGFWFGIPSYSELRIFCCLFKWIHRINIEYPFDDTPTETFQPLQLEFTQLSRSIFLQRKGDKIKIDYGHRNWIFYNIASWWFDFVVETLLPYPFLYIIYPSNTTLVWQQYPGPAFGGFYLNCKPI